jgi:hypothetical protein
VSKMKTVRNGTAAALRDPEVVFALTNGDVRVMAVEFANSVSMVADWTPTRSADDLADIAVAVTTGATKYPGAGTSFGPLLRFARSAFDAVQCDRMVLDIATDGDPHGLVEHSAEYLIDGVHTVNILFVDGMPEDLEDVHANSRYGWGGFTIPLTDPSEFPDAMRRKLLMEVM